MKADITRLTFRPDRHRAALVIQQGRASLDADLNEQEEIGRYRHESTATDVIGATGVPKDAVGGGFAISAAPGGGDLLVSPGRMYVDGILCENTPTVIGATAVSATEVSVDSMRVDGHPFAAGQTIAVELAGALTQHTIASVAASGRAMVVSAAVPGLAAGTRVAVSRVASLATQPDSYGAVPAVTPGRYCVYLDVWRRHLGPVDDPSMLETALQGDDTATRLRTVWQVKLLPMGAAGAGDCSTAIAGYPPAPSSGKLVAEATGPVAGSDPCVLPDAGGYRGLEHQLYRVEVHEVTATDVVLKWSRDNATMVSGIDAVAKEFTVDDMGRDEIIGFDGAAVIEITDERLELAGLPGDLLDVSAATRATRHITLQSAPTRADVNARPRARRWDGRLTSTVAGGVWLDLEKGLRVQLVAGELQTGDYWMIPARTATTVDPGTIEWPQSDDGTALPRLPDGVAHHYAKLALVDVDATGFVGSPTAALATPVIDCRTHFPALTAITATDVSFDPASCHFEHATNVQEALDELCARATGTCSVVVTPGPDWEAAITNLGSGSREICFPVGDYPLQNRVPVTGDGTGHLVVHGAGRGSRITVTGADAAISFENWASVTVHDMAVRSDGGDPGGGLQGALTFVSCGDVVVRDCEASCAAAPARQSSCVAVYASPIDGAAITANLRSTARVEGCTFAVGEQQVGVLLVGLGRSIVTNNVLSVREFERTVKTVGDLSVIERLGAQRLLSSSLTAGAAAGANKLEVTVAGKPMHFATIAEAMPMWKSVLGAQPTFASAQELQKVTEKITAAVTSNRMDAIHAIDQAASLHAFLNTRLVQQHTPVMGQGIVVTGPDVGEVRIDGNTIAATLQGVHVAASHSSAQTDAPDVVDRVVVTDNRIAITIPANRVRGRHGIFIGNADSVIINSNVLDFTSLSPSDPVSSTAVRVFGFAPRFLAVRDNHATGFPIGASIMMLMSRGTTQKSVVRQLLVADNLFFGSKRAVQVEGPLAGVVKQAGNVPA